MRRNCRELVVLGGMNAIPPPGANSKTDNAVPFAKIAASRRTTAIDSCFSALNPGNYIRTMGAGEERSAAWKTERHRDDKRLVSD